MLIESDAMSKWCPCFFKARFPAFILGICLPFFVTIRATQVHATQAGHIAYCIAQLDFILAPDRPDSVGQSKEYLYLQKAIEARFQDLDFDWSSRLYGGEEGKIRRQLLKLTEREKAALLQKLKDNYPNLSRAPLFIRLALNDRDAWLDYFDESTSGPSFDIKMLEDYRPLLERLPTSLKKELLAKIAEAYPAAKKTPIAKQDGKYWPKRLLDAWIRALLPGDRIFERVYSRTKNPLKAYQTYLDLVDQFIVGNMPANKSHYGTLSAKDIVAIAREIRKFLNDPIIKKKFLTSGNPRIRIFGSVVKGLGKDGSDLDMGYTGVSEVALKGEQIPSLAQRLSNLLKRRKLPIAIDFDVEQHEMDIVENNLTILEPFMIDITRTNINLLVFPLNKLGYDRSGSKYGDSNPKVFLLEGSR